MNVCFVGQNIHFLPSASGSCVLPREVIRCLCSDMDISLFTINDEDTYNREVREEVDERFKPYLKRLKSIERIRMKKSSGLTQRAKCLRELCNQIRAKEVNIIHLFELPQYMLPLVYRVAKDIGAKVVYHVFMPMSKIIEPIKAAFLERFADGVIFSTPYVSRSILTRLKKKKITEIIPPPVDTSTYRPIINKMPSLRGSDFTLFYIGPLDPKRFPTKLMVNVISRLVTALNVKLLLAVAPRYKDDLQRILLLKKFINKRGIENNVEILYRRLSYEEKRFLYGSVDAVIFPFLKSYRGVVDPPLTLIEAMACGGLIVATSVLSIPWIIKDGYNGFICPDHAQMHDVIRGALMLTDMRKSLIRNRAVETIQKRFSSTVIRSQILSFYNKIITTR